MNLPLAPRPRMSSQGRIMPKKGMDAVMLSTMKVPFLAI